MYDGFWRNLFTLKSCRSRANVGRHRPDHAFIGAPADHCEGRIPVTREIVRCRNRIRNLITSEGLPFETLCIESCLTAVVVGAGGLAVGHSVLERNPGDLERL